MQSCTYYDNHALTVVQDAELIIKPTFSAVNQPVNFSVTMVMFKCVLKLCYTLLTYRRTANIMAPLCTVMILETVVVHLKELLILPLMFILLLVTMLQWFL